MFAKEKLVSEAVVKVRKILHLMTGSNHNYAGTSFLSFLQVVYYIREFLIRVRTRWTANLMIAMTKFDCIF